MLTKIFSTNYKAMGKYNHDRKHNTLWTLTFHQRDELFMNYLTETIFPLKNVYINSLQNSKQKIIKCILLIV